jgi:DivIVA domain-containing protein
VLDPDAVAARTFGTSFRGYDPEEVRRFLVEVAADLRALAAGALEGIGDERATVLLGEEAGRLLAAARVSAAEIEAKAEARAGEVLREAQEAAVRARSTVEAERDRAYAEGALRAEEVLADAERARDELLAEARLDAEHLVAEAEAAREKVLRDLARRRKAVRAQVEQLHAARDELLKALADVTRMADEARGRMVVALPEAKLAAAAAARRAEAEDEVSVEQLESELEAFRLAGLPLVAPEGETPEPVVAEVAEVATGDDAPEVEARPVVSRVFRANRGVVEAELYQVDEAAEFEQVRVLPVADDEHVAAAEVEVGEVVESPVAEPEAAEPEAAEPEAAEPEPEPEAVVGPEPADAVEVVAEQSLEPDRPSTETVEALFARLRAGREERTAHAEAVLADRPPEPPPALDDEPPAVVVDEVAVHVGGGAERDELLARRDELLAAPVASLARLLKRLLADEQNTVLDALRRVGATTAAVTPAAELSVRWSAAAEADLAHAALAGAAFVDRRDATPADISDVAGDLAASTAAVLADRLAAAVARADGDVELAADAVRSVCREWRSRRLADAVDLAVHAAFGRGALHAVADTGTALCWVVDDGGSPCPDAEDNALAGPVAAGQPFPTGHLHPPAHPGCRCVLAVAALAASR